MCMSKLEWAEARERQSAIGKKNGKAQDKMTTIGAQGRAVDERDFDGGRAWCVWSHATGRNRGDYASTMRQTSAAIDRLETLWDAVKAVLPHDARSGGVSIFEAETSPDWESPSNVGGATATLWWRDATPDAVGIYRTLVSALVAEAAPLSTRIKGIAMTLRRGTPRYRIWVSRHDAPLVCARDAADRLAPTPRQHALALVPWFRALVGAVSAATAPMACWQTRRREYYDPSAEECLEPDAYAGDPFDAAVLQHD